MQRAFQADEHESTLVYDYAAGTVELYTTKRSVWLRAIARNPNFLSASDLKPGYSITYPIAEMRNPESAIRPKDDPTDSVLSKYLTDSEKATRSRVASNFKKSDK